MRDYLSHSLLYAYTHPDLLADPDQVHVWRINLDLDAARMADLEAFLSREEHARAARLRSATDRSRFVAARGSLRALLAHYLHLEPAQVQFAYTPEGKPVLAGGGALQFNLSHSEALAVLAVSPRRAVGIDLERLRLDFEPDALAARFFAPAEAAALQCVPPDEKHRAFLTYWTCKEAYLKAVGTGLGSPLSQFSVSLEDHSLRLIGPAGDGTAAAPYRLQPLNPDPDYVAALAVAWEPCL